MSRNGILAWMSRNAGVISVAGALVIFFSWAITNTLAQRYSRLKQSVETAESTFRLYTTLYELRGTLHAITQETLYGREAAERSRGDDPGQDPQRAERSRLRRQFSLARLSARQIDELAAFSGQTLEYSNGVGGTSGTAQRIMRVNREIFAMYEQLRELDEAAERADRTPTAGLAELRSAVERYDRFVRDNAERTVPGFYQAIVSALNTRRDEGRQQLALARRRSGLATRTALLLYFVGSVLALGGQYLDKVYNKKAPARTDPGKPG
jgi:hypothetical protein